MANSVANTSAKEALVKSYMSYPITVSPPEIHYTTIIDAIARCDEDLVFFVAYNRGYKKRILHPLRFKDGLSLKVQRRLLSEHDFRNFGSASVFDIVLDKFSGDPPSIHLLLQQPGFSGEDSRVEQTAVDKLVEELRELGSLAMTLNVRTCFLPEGLPEQPPGSRTIAITWRYHNSDIVAIEGKQYIKINQDDIWR